MDEIFNTFHQNPWYTSHQDWIRSLKASPRIDQYPINKEDLQGIRLKIENCLAQGLLISCTSACSVQFNRSVVSDSLRHHESQHARPPCPTPTPRVYSNSSPSSRWCHPAISYSIFPFSSCPQSLLASGSFPMSQLFTWGGQSIGV